MEAPSNSNRIIRFGVFEVDLREGELRRSGLRQKLSPQAFEVLRAMLERPSELITREELRERLWPGNTTVDYELGLKKCVNRIRDVLGDPADRVIDVYVPSGHSGAGLPLLVDLVGYTGGGPAHTNWKNFGENVPERLDRLIGAGAMPPVVVAFPDCFTRLGGNQYINSAAMGAWADFLVAEAVPYIEKEFHCGGRGRPQDRATWATARERSSGHFP